MGPESEPGHAQTVCLPRAENISMSGVSTSRSQSVTHRLRTARASRIWRFRPRRAVLDCHRVPGTIRRATLRLRPGGGRDDKISCIAFRFPIVCFGTAFLLSGCGSNSTTRPDRSNHQSATDRLSSRPGRQRRGVWLADRHMFDADGDGRCSARQHDVLALIRSQLPARDHGGQLHRQ